MNSYTHQDHYKMLLKNHRTYLYPSSSQPITAETIPFTQYLEQQDLSHFLRKLWGGQTPNVAFTVYVHITV